MPSEKFPDGSNMKPFLTGRSSTATAPVLWHSDFGNRELAVQTIFTPDRSGILSFLELLSGNAAIPMELHALAEDFLTDQYLPGKGRNDPQHNH